MADPRPTVDSLYEELATVRYYGAGGRLGRLDEWDLPGLVEVALAVGGKTYWPLPALVSYTVLHAVAHLSPRDTRDAAAALFGLDPENPYERKGPRVPVPTRREAAAAVFHHKPSYFERYLERPLLREMAKALIASYVDDPRTY
jgi:hypothetical protein